jgi:hypothetical protein
VKVSAFFWSPRDATIGILGTTLLAGLGLLTWEQARDIERKRARSAASRKGWRTRKAMAKAREKP